MKIFYCDECEAEIEIGETEVLPPHITGGDHYWCDDCWEARKSALRAEAPPGVEPRRRARRYYGS